MIEDYYATLEVAQTVDETVIKASYRRLARLRHPDKNPGKPEAKAQFQILSNAYETLIDAEKRKQYDIVYSSIRSARQSAGSYRNSSLRKPTYSGTQGAGPNATSYADDEEGRRVKKRIEELEKILEELWKRRKIFDSDLSEAQRSLTRLQAALDRLQAEIDKDVQEEAAKKTWFAYFFKSSESGEAKEARERRATERRTGRIVREAERDKCKARVDALNSMLRRLDMDISSRQCAKNLEEQRERWRQERLEQERREAEQRRREDEANRARQKAWEDAEKSRKEQQAREAQARREKAQEAWENAEKSRKERQARETQARRGKAQEAQRQEHRARAEKKRIEEEEARKRRQRGPGGKASQPRSQWPQAAGQTATKACVHRAWWTRVEGRHRCDRCLETTARFAFECPGCSKIACAGCRNVLRDLALY